MDEKILTMKKLLDTSHFTIAITGAGISVPAGIMGFAGMNFPVVMQMTSMTVLKRTPEHYYKMARNRINRMVKTAGFQVIKTLDDFVWNQGIELPVGLTREYMEGLQFLKPRENLIFLGSVGTGKTHLATAIALAACQAGRRVRFFTAASLANLLLERNNKGTLNSFQENLKRVELIVVDEIGFVPLHKESAELLFQVISDCYERRSLIITSNLEFSQWNTVFGDNRLTQGNSI